MQTRRNALLLFSKVPEVGKVKTRLTTLKDGYLAPEWACDIYRAMLLDVVDCCFECIARMETQGTDDVDGAILDSYDLVISSPGATQEAAMRQLFKDAGETRPITFINDTGANFDEHYNDSFSQVWAMGYDTVLSMGCDMPALTHDVIEMGYRHLHELSEIPGGGVVVSPDQEMGVSIVGWTKETAFDHTGVYYCQNGLTVLPAYVEKCQRLGLPCRYIPAMPDVDTWADLRHNITLMQAIEYCTAFQPDLTVPRRTLDALEEIGLVDVRIAPNDLMDPRDEIDL